MKNQKSEKEAKSDKQNDNKLKEVEDLSLEAYASRVKLAKSLSDAGRYHLSLGDKATAMRLLRHAFWTKKELAELLKAAAKIENERARIFELDGNIRAQMAALTQRDRWWQEAIDLIQDAAKDEAMLENYDEAIKCIRTAAFMKNPMMLKPWVVELDIDFTAEEHWQKAEELQGAAILYSEMEVYAISSGDDNAEREALEKQVEVLRQASSNLTEAIRIWTADGELGLAAGAQDTLNQIQDELTHLQELLDDN
ncbi:MAG: hypothetical protein ACE5I9_06795 [Candidatus Methylomirabilales bacterium]